MSGGLKVLVVGGGGREHTIAWKLSESASVDEVLIAPGNAGSVAVGTNIDVSADDIDGIVALAESESVDLVFVGPEDPLVAGLVDRLEAAGVAAFGPRAAIARLEGSKAFAKAFMADNQIPTAQAESFTDEAAALEYIDALDQVPVIKADGLAAGKGVIVAETFGEAKEAVTEMLVDGRFGDAGASVLVEERMFGVEASILAFCDGTDYSVMPVAADHKRLLDGDRGPNTGGMGAYVPSRVIDDALMSDVCQNIIEPTLKGAATLGCPYVGVLYAGIMVTDAGPRVVEFNCRFGDPETQVVLPLLQSDLAEIAKACTEGRLGEIKVEWSADACATVVLASGGYPGEYRRGVPISGLDDRAEAGALVFHAGTGTGSDGVPVTTGGRVLAVTALGSTLEDALAKAYVAADEISFDGAVRREDIGR